MATDAPRYRLIVDLPAGLARDASTMIGQGQPYQSMSDLLIAAVANQVHLERASDLTRWGGTVTASPMGEQEVESSNNWMGLPREEPPGLLKSLDSTGPLSPFTNRLAPLIAPLRVLAALQAEAVGPIPWDRLVDQGALCARQVGLTIREQDERAGRRGRRRRWTGWPVGGDEAASLSRFRSHFLGRIDREPEDSPLVALGLIGHLDGYVGLTQRGWQFAACATPLLGEVAEEQPLASEQQLLLAQALSQVPEEWSMVSLALSTLADSNGDPTSIDRVMTAAQPSWTDSMATSFRSAIIGRMADAGLVSVDVNSGQVFPVHGN